MARARRLSPLDAAFLYLERPRQLLHVGCLAILERPIAADRLAEVLAERVVKPLPRYRQRPVRPLLDIGWPRWEDDPYFDVRRHVRHVAVPPPGDDAAFHDLVDTLFAAPLDQAHPLWDATLIEGLPDGRAALLWRIHHSMIDGVSGAQVLELMADPSAEPAAPAATPAPPPAPARSLADLWNDVRELASPSTVLARARDAAEAASVAATLFLQRVPRVPFNGPLTDGRRIVWTSFALDDFLAMRGAAGAKVNDIVLAVITGALRRHLERRGSSRPAVRALVPVSIRRDAEHLQLGNLVSAMFPTLPVDVDDPVERLRRVCEETRTLKERGQPRASGVFMALAAAVPAPINALLARLAPDDRPVVNTVCTNVPGPRAPRSLLGSRVLDVHPIVPLFGAVGLEFAILSYGTRLSICAVADPRLVPDAAEIPGHLEAEALALATALGVSTPQAAAIAAAAQPSVGDLMTPDPTTLVPTDSLARAHRLMELRRIRHLPVVDQAHRVVGLVTHRDLLAAEVSRLALPTEADRFRLLGLHRVADVMETHVSVALPDAPAHEVGELMARHKIGCLPVVDADARLVGIVTQEDYLRWATAHMSPASRDSLPARV
jgi:diacylglycerol O-acyltransferase